MPCSRSTKYAGNKDWFGDWEKKARIEKLKVSKPIELTGEEYEGKYELNNKSAQSYIIDELRGDYTNSDTGDKIRISRKGAEKVTRHDAENHLHLKSIVAIPQMIEQATFITEEANEKQKNRFVSYRYYVVGLNIGGIDYTAKLVVGVANNGETYYDHALTEIEKGRLLESIDPIKREFANKEVSLSEYKDKRLVSILQNDSSRVVDENGEPLVVYHGTNVEFTEFRMSPDGALGKGAYFASSEEVARGYGRGGRTIPAFLSLRSPLIASGPLSPKEKEEVSHGKYDGVFATGLGFYVAFEPTQIKSATDNVGSFDVENPDIRFRIGERRKADMKAGLLNKLTNATDEQVERTINEIEKLGESFKEGGNPKLEKVAFHWAKKGTIILPEDNDKIIQAVRLAENAKVDPMKYDRPMEIINKYNTDVEYGNPINPDDIPAFTNKREIGKSGVFVYDVEESDAGQKAVCKVAHAQFGYSRKDEMSRQPWCLASFTRTGEPTQSAKGFWFNTCNSVGKKIAIPDGLHKFEGGDVRRLYQLGDYSFHGEDISDEINDEELEGVSEIEEIQSDNILAKDVSLEEAIELLNRIDIEVADGTNVAFDSSTNDIRFRLQEENDKFNKELERYAKGELGSNEYISIGKPFGVLALFMPDDQIILRQKVLSKSLKKHGLNISSIRDLPKAISKPVFIFRSKRGSLSILTELTSPEGKSIFVAIGLGAKKQLGHEFLEVNDVLTIHGREEENVILPIIENNSLIWVDKEKGQRWLSSAKSNSQAIANDALSSATKIIKEFENPTSMDIRLRANREETAYDMAFGRSVKESMVKQVAKKFSVPMSTKVVSRLDLPEEQQKKSVIYDNGTLSIVAENIKDGDIELATLNEVLPKQGLSALVDSNVQEDILTVLGKASGAFMGNASQESVRSYISDLHTQSVSPDMIGAMADVMRGMLDAAGFNSKLSDPNAAYMLYKAIRGDKNGSTAAEDIVSKMQEANVRKVLSDYDEVFNKMTDEQIMDELNPEHNEDLRTRIENAQRRINAVNAMFRYESDNTGRSMAETMHQIYSKRGIEWRRKWVDETVVFDQYQKEIEKLTGKKVPDFANLHEIYNQSSSIATATIDRLEKHYYKPAIEQARKVKELLGFNDRQLHDYMIAKHAPERNAKM
ncbi:hypothetical protein PORCRE_1435 [Porphyromonas crevioricanis JCM 15906]|uniref:Phage MuF C-terminal domain-containing protein n=1 Tax=Porphyromonas crevioricanis JCM 15906 TaxID=1305617 RepID=T1CRP0_9PORP|nr:hypothetical protein [Porphyromonas crevioricanis]GAD05728.1 hypothetical protein PORCRE_1435 [Porphyromonas crevioricanis JCM 15906]SKA00935.1 hypothetical protein SAMN02745203_01577 [Porphyromonas crevioricanis]